MHSVGHCGLTESAGEDPHQFHLLVHLVPRWLDSGCRLWTLGNTLSPESRLANE